MYGVRRLTILSPPTITINVKPFGAQFIADILYCFCSFLGRKVGHDESRVCVSKWVSRVTKDSFEQPTNIKYPYIRGMKNVFFKIYDNVASKLACWKGRVLKKSSHVTLPKSFLHRCLHIVQKFIDSLNMLVRLSTKLWGI
jgi:hypothetical protein